MPHLFVILLKINLVLAVFAIAYYLILRRLTFYVLNRFFLVLGILFSSVYPFIDLTDFFHNQEQLSQPITTLVPAINQRVAALAPTDFFTQYGQLISILLYAGVAVMAVRFLLQFVSLYRLHKNSSRGVVNGMPVRILEDAVNPFSFWQTIYINPSLHKEQALPAILAHEHIHVKQWHTLDIMLAELSVVFYWFNPGVWLINKAVKENLEFITDAKVLKSGADKKAYQYSLLDTGSMAVASAIFANSFNMAGLKKRIKMMNARRSSRLSLSRYVLLIPVLLITTLLFAVSNRKVIQYVEPVIPQVVYSAITGASGSEHIVAPKKTTRKPASLYTEAVEPSYIGSPMPANAPIRTVQLGTINGVSNNSRYNTIGSPDTIPQPHIIATNNDVRVAIGHPRSVLASAAAIPPQQLRMLQLMKQDSLMLNHNVMARIVIGYPKKLNVPKKKI